MKITYKKLFRNLPFTSAVRFSFLLLVKKLFANEANLFFSQTGEDLILKSILGHKSNGFYVDVGCNKPYYLSNTFYLYLNGWRGICIDANEKLCSAFKRSRPRDTVITAAVSDIEKDVTFYVSDDVPAVSTIDANQYEEWKKHWQFTREVRIRTRRLEQILDENIVTSTSIDLLSVDVEGHDFEALRSINLARYRPRLIVVEMHGFGLTQMIQDPICNYLQAFD